MKKFVVFITAALVLVAALPSCKDARKSALSLEEAKSSFYEEYYSIFEATTATEDEIVAKAISFLENGYKTHRDDSLGLSLFMDLMTNIWEKDRTIDEYEKASELIRTSEAVETKIAAIRADGETAPGKPYRQISGIDPITGAADSLSAHLGTGKPLLLDFWASWCGPCRHCINTELLPAHAAGTVDILGIAVWEEKVEDTQKAMSELGITWPVIYTGGRKNSPSITYGVLGIPTLVLIGADGTILYKGHYFEEAKALL